jgi:polyribonucleotide nucleotidyltransferase
MFDNYFRKDIAWGGQMLTLETGKVARQADGAVMARLGDTIVLCTVVGARSVKPGQDFFPLTVNYQEKAFAAGKIPGGFFKREGRPVRDRDADLPPDRPPAAPPLPRGLPQRGAGHRHRHVP